MPAAYSTGATQPLTPKDKSAHSRFRLGASSSSSGHPQPAAGESTTTPPDSPLRPRFLRRQHHQSSTKHAPATDKIPWDSPSSPPKPPLGPPPPPPPTAPPPSATRSQSDTALLQARDVDDGARGSVPVSPAKSVPSGKGGQASGSSAGGGGGGGFRRLVTKGSKFSLRSTFAPLTGSHPHAREHSGSTTSPPTSPPLSSRFPSSSSAASFRSRSGSTDLRHQPFVGTRGFATYPREISSPTGSRVGPAPVALLLATPLPSPAEHDYEWASSATQDEGGPGRVGGKAARFLGEAVVPSGKAAKLLGMERKKTLVKKPSSASLLTADLSDRHRQSLVPSTSFDTLGSSTSSRPPTSLSHNRQRSISVPVRCSPGALLGGLGIAHGSDGDYDDDFWRPATPLTPPTMSRLAPGSAFVTSDYDGSSPTQTIENSPLRERRRAPSHSSSRDSFPQTARITSFASSTFSPSGIPSFYPASSTAEPEWRNSTWSARPDSADVSSGLALDPGPPRLPKPKRLSPESIRFSAIFAGRTSDLFSGTSASAGGSSSEEASLREGSSGAGARASTRPSMGSRAPPYESSGGAESGPAAAAAELSRTGSPASWSTGSASLFPTTAAPSTLSLPALPPPVSPLPTPPPARTPPPPPPSSRPPSSTRARAPRATQPRRSNTLLSIASSHTRRSQRSHALDALEGRPRRTRARESSGASSAAEAGASVDAIAVMERRALEAGGLVRAASDDGGAESEDEGEIEEAGSVRGGGGGDRAAGEAAQLSRKSRPFLDFGWSSDECEEASRAQPSRRVKRAPPPMPSATSTADPAAAYPGRPPATTSSALSFSTSSSSASQHSHARRQPVAAGPTVHLPRRLPPPPAPSPAPGAPLPPLPHPLVAPTTAPSSTLPPLRPKHARHASMQSSILSLSSSEDDDDVRGAREVVSAFPAPPPSRLGGGARERR
ncbi:hypothetical protein JCM9279_005486 [Rhodotorula babjevae]